MNPEKMKVSELRDALEARGLDTKGTKPFLVERLKEALAAEAVGEDGEEAAGGGEEENEAPMEAEEDQGDEAYETEDGPVENGSEDIKEEAAQAAPVNGANGDAHEEGDAKPKAVGETKAAKTEVSDEGKGVKRKLEEPEELGPWIIREDEPEIDENFLCLDWYNSDLNLRIKQEDLLTALPMNKDCWSWCYAGARATHGFRSGKIYFEVKLTDALKVWIDRDGFHYDVRVGWSTNYSPLMLGEDKLSWAYSGVEGKKVHNKVWEEYGEKFEKGDTVGAYLDMSGDTVSMTFTKNGKIQGPAFQFPRSELGGEALFPHILSRNTKFEVNFGKNKAGEEVKPFNEPAEGLEEYTQAALLPVEERVRGLARIATRGECEMILLVGLPSAGKTTWARNHAAAHPEKKYEIINAAIYLEKATVNGVSRKEHAKMSWDKVHHRVTKNLMDVTKVASSRRRNVILDQTNVYGDAQLRKVRPFEQMKRRCVVIVPTDEELQARRKKQEEEGEKNIPDDAVNEMKANMALPAADSKAFDEIIFPELQREEAQTLIDQYNKEAKEKGFGKKHEEYKNKWEMNKRMRLMTGSPYGPRPLFGAPGFGRGGMMPPVRGFPYGGGMRGGPSMIRPLMRGGWGAGGGGGGYGGGYGGGWGGAPRGGVGGSGGGGGFSYGGQQYPGRRNWGGWS